MQKTELLYLADSYLKTCEAIIEHVEDLNGQTIIYLDKTIFYAQGGGQPADAGLIKGENGVFTVTHVSYNGGEIQHKGTVEGSLTKGEKVTLTINWEARYTNMQAHTAGHILDQAVKNVLPHVKGVDGNHGIGKHLSVDFDQEILETDLPKIQAEINSIISSNLDITAEMVTHQNLVEREISLPFDLPKNKELRIVQIGEYPPMPDGGTQLKSTGESQPITVGSVQQKDGLYRLVYSLGNSKVEISKQKEASNKPSSITLEQLTQHLDKLKIQLDLDLSNQSQQELKTKYLSKKGVFTTTAKLISEVIPEDRRQAGQLINETKLYIENLLSQATGHRSQAAAVDMTLPGVKPSVGHVHPISQAMEEITGIFEKIGFTRVRYPEIDWDWYVFESLNMAPHHPARDEWETFFVDMPDTTENVEYDASNPRKRHPSLVGGKVVLTTHTSNGQVREMERLKSQPPIRMINIARCYRRQQDATHTQMFHQFEGLVIDKNITIQHLKGTLDYFAKEFYGEGVKSRIRPFHFQFTEPSFEVDFSCHICHGTGYLSPVISSEIEKSEQILNQVQDDTKVKCKFCKSGWHEVGGAGMVHPNVLKAGGIDPDEYTGFAFGWGVERTYTLKPGLNIDDIRGFYNGDLQFLEQF